jgi:hypothetical protein
MPDISDCPRCSKKTLVNRRDELYQCLGCDYTKDFAAPKPDPQANAGREVGSGLLLGFIIYLIYLSFTSAPQPSLPQPGVLPGSFYPALN